MNPPFSLTSSFAAPRRLKAGPWSLPVSMYGRLRRGVDRRRRRRWLERRHYGGYGGYGPSRRAERRRYYTRAEGFAAAPGFVPRRSSAPHGPTLAAATARQPAVRRAPFSPTGRLHYTHLCPGICTIFSALKSDLQAALQPCSASLLYPTLLMHDFLVLKSELQAAIRSGTFRKF